MREILFRGKRLQGGDWVEGYFYKSDINKRERESGKATLIFTPDCDTFMFILETHNSVMVIPETIGQYTGIKDKNGTKIFENDILSAHPDELFPDDEIRLVVEWHDYGWFGKDSKGRYTSLESKWVSELFEVIGNRIDNPELLKGE